jgi:hypothetical protein
MCAPPVLAVQLFDTLVSCFGGAKSPAQSWGRRLGTLVQQCMFQTFLYLSVSIGALQGCAGKGWRGPTGVHARPPSPLATLHTQRTPICRATIPAINLCLVHCSHIAVVLVTHSFSLAFFSVNGSLSVMALSWWWAVLLPAPPPTWNSACFWASLAVAPCPRFNPSCQLWSLLAAVGE